MQTKDEKKKITVDDLLKTMHKNIKNSKFSENFLTLKERLGNPYNKEEPLEQISLTNKSSKFLPPQNASNTSIEYLKTLLQKHKEQTVAESQSLQAASTIAKTLHKPWQIYRTIAGHNGWIRCLSIDPNNNFFVTGSNDKLIKFWDMASGNLLLTYTGHLNTVRSIIVSRNHPYLFSSGEDKQVKCWDLECNKAIRSYHAHLSGVYTMCLHPKFDVFITGGRDCVGRVWDMRSRQQIMILEGHSSAITSVLMQENEPQIITGSNDIKLWDIRNGKLLDTLTYHCKSIRKLILPNDDYAFISAGCDDIKLFKCPEGSYLRSFVDDYDNKIVDNGIVNSIALNKDNILVSAGEDGYIKFWDYKTGKIWNKMQVPMNPGSIEADCPIYDVIFDESSTRMISVGGDKVIKMWKEEGEDYDLYEEEEEEN